MGFGVLNLETRTDGVALYPVGNATVTATFADRRVFFESDHFVVLITSLASGSRLDSRQGLQFISDLNAALDAVDGVFHGRVRSLATLMDPVPGKAIITSPNFLDQIPVDELAYQALLDRIDDSPLAHGLFLSPSGQAATISIPVQRNTDRVAIAADLERVLAEHRSNFNLRLTGSNAAEVLLGRAVLKDLGRLIPIMVAVIALLVFVCLRKVGYMLIAMGEVLMVLVCTLGTMGIMGIPITLVTTILPVLVMSVTLSDEIHLLDRFRGYLDANATRSQVREAIRRALRELTLPIVLTSLTTSIGFLSFLSANVVPLRHFGIFAALGVVFAMLMTFTFVPAMVVLLPVSWFKPSLKKNRDQRPPSLQKHERFIANRVAMASMISAVVLLAALPGLLRLSVHDSWIQNFNPDSDITSAERDFNNEFWGSYRFDIVLEGSERLFFHRNEGLQLINTLEQLASTAPHVGGVASHRIAFQIVADAWELETPVYNLPPETVRRIARLLNRVQRKTDMDQLLGMDGSKARVRLFVKSADYDRTSELIEYLKTNLSSRLEGTGIDFHFSGDLPIAQAVVSSIVSNTLKSVGWTVVGITLMLALFFRSVRQAVITMLPLIAGITVVLGGMGYLNMTLGVASSMFIAVMIGIAVDFTIHFCHTYTEHRNQKASHNDSLVMTFATSGRSIRWNAIILSIGLMVLSFSGIPPNQNLGLLLTAAIIACYAMTICILPLLLSVTTPTVSRDADN